MKKNELKFFKKLLEEKKAIIANNINSSVNDITELRANGAVDEFDVASMNTDLNLEYSINQKQLQQYASIEAALKRIENGTYGICESCEENISLERLKARPESRLCVACKELSEKSQK